jgi:protein-L-isoaspartate(D-aspartate) O-methyltransferase
MIAPSSPTAPNEAFLADARSRMVDSQIRPNKVTDQRILDAMRRLPRERFLPEPQLALAYADQNVPLGHGRAMLQPLALARLVQAAEPLAGDKVLVVAAGTGYSAALFAALGCDVTALEEPGSLLDLAKPVLASMAGAIRLVSGPLPEGWPGGAPYDIILIDGAVAEVPPAVASQLNRQTGRLLTVIGPNGASGAMPRAVHTGLAVHVEPTPAGISVRALFDYLCPILPAFVVAPAFEF